MTFEFDDATTLTPGAGPGEWVAALGSGWSFGPAVNGGLLMALAVQALRQEMSAVPHDLGHDDILAVSAHFLSAGAPGPARVATEILRRGRTLSTGQAALTQEDGHGGRVERLRLLATYGDLDASRDLHRSSEPPDIPAPDRCVRALDAPPEARAGVTVVDRLDLRLDPASAGWAMGEPSGRGEMRAWIRFADRREVDPLALVFLLDAMPPVSLDLGIPGWAPTIEFSGHVRARPAPGWLRMRVSTENLSGGLMEEDAWIWDETGRLVAQSRQLCGVRQPAGRQSPSPTSPGVTPIR